MKKRVLGILASLALLAVMLPGVAAASEVDGRPGQYEIEAMGIDTWIDGTALDGHCWARYAEPVAGNNYISGFGDVTIKENKNFIHVTCKFLDISGIYETNAEVGTTEACSVGPSGGLSGGTGRVTAAANNPGADGEESNVTLKCTFVNSPA